MNRSLSRRSFLTAAGFASLGLGALYGQELNRIEGFEHLVEADRTKVWKMDTDRKIRVGLAGFGLCEFASQFYFQNHPNVEVVAVTDLFPDRCEGLAQKAKCGNKYPSLEEMVKDDNIEAVFVATDAPSHADHVIAALKHGKHVASAVPACWGSLEDADRLYEAVKETGLTYAMFETTAFRAGAYAARQLYGAGAFGKMIYTEGEYFHYGCGTLPGYKDWRRGLPPQWYPTHSNVFYTTVTGKGFTEVSCMGMPSILEEYQKGANPYDNPFGTEIALFRTEEGGMARMGVSWDSCGAWGSETGRMRGEIAGFDGDNFQPQTDAAREKAASVDPSMPALPEGVEGGYHGGSHGPLMCDFIDALLRGRRPTVDIAMALNLTVPGIVAHASALKDGELMKIKRYEHLA